MSHIPLRKEKDCLNCGTEVQDRYCPHCGQENVVPHETFWHMFTHFFYDITHFDTNFFSTVRHLIFKPGFLSKEYIKGRRASYLHPIRMYVFTSAFFFLLFFSVFALQINEKHTDAEPLGIKERAEFAEKLQQLVAKDTGNLFLKNQLALFLDSSALVTRDDMKLDTVREKNKLNISIESGKFREYRNVQQYDSMQKLLPPEKRDGWFSSRLKKFAINFNASYRKDPGGTVERFTHGLLHKLPYMLFVSLPLFALILQLVFIRRKQFYYADHGVFTIHLYIFTFLVLLVVFSVDKLSNLIKSGIWDWMKGLLLLSILFYLYKAMRNFYGQKRGKTFLKFLLVSLLSFLMMLILFIIFTLFSAVTFN